MILQMHCLDTFSRAAFKFNSLFSGAKERRPRWKRMMQTQERLIGELLGQLYVREFLHLC